MNRRAFLHGSLMSWTALLRALLLIAVTATSVEALLIEMTSGRITPSTGEVDLESSPLSIVSNQPSFALAPHIHFEPISGLVVIDPVPPHTTNSGFIDLEIFGSSFAFTGHFTSPFFDFPLDIFGHGIIGEAHERTALIVGVPEPPIIATALLGVACLAGLWLLERRRSSRV
jgi:hypothetical protein